MSAPIEVWQLNMNHCKLAMDLMWQSTAESRGDVALLSDPYRVPLNGAWVADKERSVAIRAMGRYPIQEIVGAQQSGFTIAKINGIYFCSCYAPPRWSLDRFTQMLEEMTVELVGRSPVLIAGDFNAWAVEWGSRSTDARGARLLEAMAKLDVLVANEGTVSTFRKNGVESIIDVTFCSPSLLRGLNWRVSEEYTASDHQALRYSLGRRDNPTRRGTRACGRRWKTKQFDRELFVEALNGDSASLDLTPEDLTRTLVRACDATMARRKEPRNQRSSAYWYTAEIGELRAVCFAARRRQQRASAEEREARSGEYRVARSALRRKIEESKSSCLRELCRDADENPWGGAYRVVMTKIRGASVPMERCAEKLATIVEGLFPQHDPTEWPPTPYGEDEGARLAERLRVTNAELIAAAKGLKLGKAPGPDGIPNEALRAAVQAYPDMFRTVMQRCLNECHFPDVWKVQKLVLLPKPGKPPGDPSSYRPICLLDTLGKLLERVILNRLSEYTEGEHGLSERQFGFRKGRSTVDAMQIVIGNAEKALLKQRRGDRYCAIITIDVKNAFNSASWEAIAKSLHKMRVPDSLCKMLESYFQNRVLVYETDQGQRSVNVTAGVPQGSILGPALWNGMYDGVLLLDLPGGVEIVGFADDIVLTATGASVEEVQLRATDAVEMIADWMREARLEVAHHKTEIVMISNRKSVQVAELEVGAHAIPSKRELKYLGVMIDNRLNFNSHVDYVCGKAAESTRALSRMMANSYGPSYSKRRLLANVSSSVLRYGGAAWIRGVTTQRNKSKLDSTFRLMALRVICAYRTTSTEAAHVIAGTLPISILLKEDFECYSHKGVPGIRTIKRAESMATWQSQWDAAEHGRWTHRLIPNLRVWVDRRHGQLDFYVTQFLSGHGCFKQYLHRIGRTESPFCPECGDQVESPEHVLFMCPRFQHAREDIPNLNADNIVSAMCSSEEMWMKVSRAITVVMCRLQMIEREERAASQLDRRVR